MRERYVGRDVGLPVLATNDILILMGSSSETSSTFVSDWTARFWRVVVLRVYLLVLHLMPDAAGLVASECEAFPIFNGSC